MKRCITLLRTNGLVIEAIVTDRHKTLIAYLKTKEGDIIHYFDCWHVAKCKSLEAPDNSDSASLKQ